MAINKAGVLFTPLTAAVGIKLPALDWPTDVDPGLSPGSVDANPEDRFP